MSEAKKKTLFLHAHSCESVYFLLGDRLDYERCTDVYHLTCNQNWFFISFYRVAQFLIIKDFMADLGSSIEFKIFDIIVETRRLD